MSTSIRMNILRLTSTTQTQLEGDDKRSRMVCKGKIAVEYEQKKWVKIKLSLMEKRERGELPSRDQVNEIFLWEHLLRSEEVIVTFMNCAEHGFNQTA